MKIEFNGNQGDLSTMLLSAERYALGRRTYIVEWTCSFIKKNLHLISLHDKQIMIRDIEEAYSYGDECDKKEWSNLLEKLKKEIVEQ